MGKQGHGRRLTDKERMEIIEITRQNPRIKHVELATKYSVNESTIRKWRLKVNAEKIETRYCSGVEAARDTRQRGQAVKNALFDTTLYEWIRALRDQNIDLPPVKIREKARQLAESYEGMQDFKASSGWYYRFCRRYGLPCPSVKRETDANSMSGAIAVVDDNAAAGAETAIRSIDRNDEEQESSVGSAVVLDVSTTESAAIPSVFDPPPYDAVEQLPIDSGKRKFEETALGGDSEVAPAEKTKQQKVDAAAAAPFAATPQLTTQQEAISHFLHYHKDLLSVPCRLRFIKHLAHVAGEAEMYSVMDDETRVELIKEFADKTDTAMPVDAVTESLVV